MINSVRNTTLAILNKNNYGYIPPMDFNLFAKQAQLEAMEDFFYKHNQFIAKMNAKMSNSDYSDISQRLKEVIEVFSEVELLTNISDNEFTKPSDVYLLDEVRYGGNEVEKVTNSKILKLLSSNLTAPTTQYPAYTLVGNKIVVYPENITSNVSCHYIRHPKDPKWTYINIINGEPMFDPSSVNGEPMFDPSSSDYQDFELPKSFEPTLISKICQFAGLSIREADVYNFGTGEETKEIQQEQ